MLNTQVNKGLLLPILATLHFVSVLQLNHLRCFIGLAKKTATRPTRPVQLLAVTRKQKHEHNKNEQELRRQRQ